MRSELPAAAGFRSHGGGACGNGKDSGASSGALGIVIDAMCLEAREAWRIRSEELGDGPLYFNLLQGTLSKGCWRQLWQLRSNDRLRLVYSRFVVSQTCLLADEIAGGVTSGPGLQVPTGSSWVTVEVDVSEFADNGGELDIESFEQTLQEAVVNGDRFHDRMRWPTAQMRHDAWLNRRLAVNVAGIGTLVRSRDVDPGRFSTLDAMSGLLQQARRVLSATTRNLATRDGNVPALELADPGRLVPGGSIADGWARRWRQALEGAAVRNRNLLAVSPWSIFPHGCADFRYANLLPLLRFADVCPFGRPPDITDWNLRSFRNFHQQAAAVLHQRGAADQIAVHA
jgi:hypothetical protein